MSRSRNPLGLERWIDRSQPQTLMTATVILYLNAAFLVIYGSLWFFPFGTLLFVGQLAAGLGVANEKKWGYWLGVGLISLYIGYVVQLRVFTFSTVVNLMFYCALLALLLHPMSRAYRKTWFH